MLIEIFSIILSGACLVLTIISSIALRVKERKIHKIKIKFGGDCLAKKVVKPLLWKTSGVSADMYLKILYDRINEIYPHSDTKIFIKVIKEKNYEHPEDSKVVTCITYPPKDVGHINMLLYTIKNNTDLYSIYVKNKEYFLVSNLKEFEVFSEYKNENSDFMKRWSTSIVYPIKDAKDGDLQSETAGFLCVNSTKEFNDVKKNEKVIECVKKLANKLYEVLLKQDMIDGNVSEND